MRTFEHFPKDSECVLCGTNEDKECFLAGKDCTGDGSIEEAQVIHVDCLKGDGWRYNEAHCIIYRFV